MTKTMVSQVDREKDITLRLSLSPHHCLLGLSGTSGLLTASEGISFLQIARTSLRPHAPIQRPIPNRLGNILRLDIVVPLEIGDGPRHSQHLVVGAGYPAQVFLGSL
jgi:hypothetical protein